MEQKICSAGRKAAEENTKVKEQSIEPWEGEIDQAVPASV